MDLPPNPPGIADFPLIYPPRGTPARDKTLLFWPQRCAHSASELPCLVSPPPCARCGDVHLVAYALVQYTLVGSFLAASLPHIASRSLNYLAAIRADIPQSMAADDAPFPQNLPVSVTPESRSLLQKASMPPFTQFLRVATPLSVSLRCVIFRLQFVPDFRRRGADTLQTPLISPLGARI